MAKRRGTVGLERAFTALGERMVRRSVVADIQSRPDGCSARASC